MSDKSSCHEIASAMAFLSQALLFLLLSVSILGAGDLEANEYGDIDETPMGTEPAALEEVAGLAGGSEEIGTEEAASSKSIESEDVSASSGAIESSSEDAATEIDPSETNETGTLADADEIKEELEAAEPTMAEAVAGAVGSLSTPRRLTARIEYVYGTSTSTAPSVYEV